MKKNNIENFEDITDYLIFQVGDNYFSIYTNNVIEVISEHDLTLLPFVPDYIDGLINIKGQVLPQLNLRKFFLSDNKLDYLESSELIIVETSRSPCALKIDNLLGKFSIENKQIKSIKDYHKNEEITENINNDNNGNEDKINKDVIEFNGINKFITGEFNWNNKIVLILESNYFGEVINSKDTPSGGKGLLGKNEETNEIDKNEFIDCLVVSNGQEKYALKLMDILEIVDADQITSLPGSPDEIIGITMVRDNPLVVLSLSEMLGNQINNDNSQSIVVVERGNAIYGLQVDAILGISYFDFDLLQVIEDDNAELSGILTTSSNEIIGLIQPENLINDEAHKHFIKYVPEKNEQIVHEEEQSKSVLHVTIGDEEYAIPLEDINKIVEYKEPEVVTSEINKKIVGAVDINGIILPVLDIALSNSNNISPEIKNKLKQDVSTRGFVIIGIENKEWALTVSEAKEIIDLPLNNIEKISESDSGFIDGIANIGDQLISLINVQAILSVDV